MPRRTPKPCPIHGCPQLHPCPTHIPTPWANSEQRRPHALRGRALQKRNADVIARARGRCQVCNGQRCGNQHLEVDHADGNHANNDPANLRALGADPCHAEQTRAQAARGRARPRGDTPSDAPDGTRGGR